MTEQSYKELTLGDLWQRLSRYRVGVATIGLVLALAVFFPGDRDARVATATVTGGLSQPTQSAAPDTGTDVPADGAVVLDTSAQNEFPPFVVADPVVPAPEPSGSTVSRASESPASAPPAPPSDDAASEDDECEDAIANLDPLAPPSAAPLGCVPALP